MEENLRIGLLLLASVILFLILFESWLRRRRLRLAQSSSMDSMSASTASHYSAGSDSCTFNMPETEEPMDTLQEADLASSLLVISIFAKNQTRFVSYDLLQSISSTGMQFGDMNIFHYHQTTHKGTWKLFSLASATKPGEFNLDRMGDFSCAGLTLFMDLSNVPDPDVAFDIMLQTAEQLADDLDGEMRAGPHILWSENILQQYKQKVARYRTVKH